MTEEAVAAFKKAMALQPDNPDIHFNLALAYERQGLLGEAEKEYTKTLKLNPGDNDARKNIERLYGIAPFRKY
jgi:Flp pilus assembly protein TadD